MRVEENHAVARYGDNIYQIAGTVRVTLRLAGWATQKIDGIMKEIHDAPSYDSAVEICRRYITLGSDE